MTTLGFHFLGLGWARLFLGESIFSQLLSEWGGGSSPVKTEPPQIVFIVVVVVVVVVVVHGCGHVVVVHGCF